MIWLLSLGVVILLFTLVNLNISMSIKRDFEDYQFYFMKTTKDISDCAEGRYEAIEQKIDEYLQATKKKAKKTNGPTMD